MRGLRPCGNETRYRRREGRRQFYRANHGALGPFAGALEAFWNESLQRLRVLAELRDRGLITAAEYEDRRRTILERI